MSRLERAADAAQILSAVVVVVSVTIAVLAYLNEAEKQRREYTMELALQFFAGDLQEHKNHLFDTIRSIQDEVKPARLGGADIGTYLVKSDRFSSLADRDLNAALLGIASYFNAAQRCVQTGICDEMLMRQLVSEDATAIACAFRDYLGLLSDASNVESLTRGINYFDDGTCA